VAVICTKPPTARFVLIRNEWARDRRISLKGVGLLTYLHSHEDGYELSLAQMIRDHTDGKDAVRTGLEELEANGYLRRIRAPRAEGGRWGETDYVLADPFDTAGRLMRHLTATSDERETRLPFPEDERETRQSGLSAPGTRADYPARIIRPIEEQGENTRERPTVSLSPEEGFATFWAAYPKKVGKDAARRAWVKAIRRADAAKIIDVVSRYPFRTDRQFIKDPSTWLNAGCWEDDLDAVAAANRGGRVGSSAYGPYQNPDPTAHPDAFAGSF
jgi:hypothetical protein